MARPQKEGLDYFPVDVDIDQDDKLVVPIAKHGMLGFGVIVKLMMEVYKNGYFYPWTEKEQYVFPFKISVDVEKVSEIVIDCINSGFFCINQYNRNHILTSYGFQKRFLLASTRRKESVINIQYLVGKELMQTETELMQTETQKMDAESTQRKVKEIILNKKKILPLINLHKITYENDDQIEFVESYLNAMDFEVMEDTIKRSSGKHINYLLKTLKNLMSEGKTKKESLAPKFVSPTEQEAINAQRKAEELKNQTPLSYDPEFKGEEHAVVGGT